MLTQQERQQMDSYLSVFMKQKDKGTTVQKIRHKLGSVIWPLANKAVIFGMAGMAGLILGGGLTAGTVAAAIPAVATFTAVGVLAAYVTSGYMSFVQNVTLRKAALLGKTMVRDRVPEHQRQYAIEKYLKKEGALFLNKKYMRKNPDKIALLRDGQNVPPIPNLIAFIEDNSNRALSGGKRVTFSARKKFWHKSMRDILKANAHNNPVSLFKRPPVQTKTQTNQSTNKPLLNRTTPLQSNKPLTFFIRNKRSGR